MEKRKLNPAQEQELLERLNLIGVIGVNNVSVIDRPFSTLMNNGHDLLNAVAVYGAQAPIKPIVISAGVPNGAQLTRLGAIATISDLVAEVRFDQSTMDGIMQNKLAIAGFVITQRFKNNAVAAPYELITRYYRQYGTDFTAPVIATELNRDPQIEPSAGANSAAEFVMLSVVPGLVYDYNTGDKKYDVASEQQQGYALPILFANQNNVTNFESGLIAGCALIFQNQAAIPQTLTVTPIICSAVSLRDVKEILTSGLSR